MDSTAHQVRKLLDDWSEAIRSKDIDWLMSLYAADAVYFDVVPPLQIRGSAAVRSNFLRWFDGWSSPIRQDVSDLNVLVSGDLAFAYMLIRAGGTLRNGREVGYWVRTSVGCRCSSGTWQILHEHVSLPVELPAGTAAMKLMP